MIMNFTKARLITSNPAPYTNDEIRSAASYVLGTLNASEDMLNTAYEALAHLDSRYGGYHGKRRACST